MPGGNFPPPLFLVLFLPRRHSGAQKCVSAVSRRSAGLQLRSVLRLKQGESNFHSLLDCLFKTRQFALNVTTSKLYVVELLVATPTRSKTRKSSLLQEFQGMQREYF